MLKKESLLTTEISVGEVKQLIKKLRKYFLVKCVEVQ